ncbi:MAG: TPM domain-containing protein [Chitinophaga sp.]|uniref:TPM domain-containing protein n=1 Tax=Chitinophaga sp. TaxID=1869181 RepID=UPI0025C432C3|nr:TPM domain-containing protein [Chitinophaga sp.]MBV8254079.1 TPM domain-containing protein [Chitinophaga sp.]
MKYRSLLLAIFVLLCSCQQEKHKFSPNDIPDPKQQDGGYVSDPKHMLSDATVSELNGMLAGLDKEGTAQVAVVLQEQIGDNEPKEFAHQLFNTWGIGRKETNNGLLIFLVKDAHKLVFETGKGLEGDLPDILCFHIQQEYMIPKIKENNYDEAFINGVKAVASQLKTGNYVYDRPSADTVPPADNSLLSANAEDSAGYEATPLLERVPVASNEEYVDNSPGAGFVICLFICFFLSIILMYAWFGRTPKKRKASTDEDVMPVSISDTANEFLRPGWIGLVMINLAAVVALWYMESAWSMRMGFFKVLMVYYLCWAIFMHGAVLIIRMRAEIALKGADRHTRWQRLNAAHKNLDFAGYLFPLPFLLLYMRIFHRYMQRLRDESYSCPHCNKPMHKLDEKTEDHFLDQAQIIEEKLHSVDYDVWVCDTDNYQLVLDYTDLHTVISECPTCHHKTYQCKKSKTQKRATTYSAGWGLKTYVCAACAFTADYRFVIPKISESSSSSSGGSSSSSSWGGGSSGGGGASSSW